MFHTWLANVNRSNVVIVTDSEDSVLHYRAAEAGEMVVFEQSILYTCE